MKDIKSCEKSFRDIWIAMQVILSGDKSRTVVISSATKGEGVTTTIINLGKAIALEKKVLLLEANFENPIFSNIFNLPQENGLTDILSGKLEIEKAIKRKDENRNLFIITAGSNISDHHSLALPEWEDLLYKLKEIFDIILIDTPSVTSNPDVASLASICDGIILVIQADKTRREVVEHAKRTINNAKAKLLGSILNRRVY
ncbi:MAG: CpsD/CapB family tyrosine-protein kinase, partial [Candidatus Firestonebacteria bacterium]|nr:CpsD/CapB family tyrosine-protein kinase [Candidatus Firestonebacteria bacterium]